MIILDDDSGNRVANFRDSFGPDPSAITQEILKEWLNGRGKKPVTWNTLIWALNKAKLHTLAGDVRRMCTETILNVPFKGPVYDYALKFAEEIRSTYLNQTAIDPYQKLLSNINFEGVEFELPFVLPKINGDISLMTNNTPGSRILFTGRPGVGKSILTRYMALKWAKGELLTNCLLAIRVPLMSTIPDVRTLLEKSLLYYPDSSLVQQEINRSKGEGVCFILDALDEYSPAEKGDNDLVYSLIRSETLQQATVLVTSRMFPKVNELKKVFKRRYEVIGFGKSDIDLFIEKLPFKLQLDISTVFKANYNVKEMCYLPLHMTMIVYLASVDKERLSVTDTETVLYTDFLLLTMHQYQKRTGWSAKMTENCLRDSSVTTELCLLLRKISMLARDALLERMDTLNSTFLSQSQIETLEQISLFGLEIEHGRHYDVYYFSFTHRTFQEYLAAFYISQLPEDLAIEALEQHFEVGRFRNVWVFYFGIMGHYRHLKSLNTISTLTKLYISKFMSTYSISAQQSHRCTLDLGDTIFFIQLAYEAKVASLLQTFMEATNITGPECEYLLSFSVFKTYDCLFLAFVLNYVQIHSLVLEFHLSESDTCSCQMVFLKELKLQNRITSVVNLTVGDIDYKQVVFIVVPIINLASNLQHLNLVCGKYNTNTESTSPDGSKQTSCYMASPMEVNREISKLLSIHSTKLKELKLSCLLISVEEISKLIPQLTSLYSLSVLLPSANFDTTVAGFAQSLSTVQTLNSLEIAWINHEESTKISEFAALKIATSIKKIETLKEPFN